MTEKLKEKYIGTMLGVGIGDALGAPVEGWKPSQINRHVGRLAEIIDTVLVKDNLGNLVEQDEDGQITYISKSRKAGEWTDDTILAVDLAEALVDKGMDISRVASGSVMLLQKYLVDEPKDYHVFGPTTISAFENLKKGVSPELSGILGTYPSNGPVIKMPPLGLYINSTNRLYSGLKFTEQVAKMSHLDPRSVVAGVVQASNVNVLLQDVTRRTFLDSMVATCSYFEKSKQQGYKVSILDKLKWIRSNPDASNERALERIENGWAVTKNFPFAMFIFQKYWNDPIEGLIEVVNQGYDCDSTGSMVGALIGAKHGNIWPREWLEHLEGRDQLFKLGIDLSNIN